MILRFIHIITCVNNSFLLIPNNMPLNGQTIICLPMHLLMDMYMGYFQFGAIAIRAFINIRAQVFTSISSSLGKTPNYGMAES